MLQYHVLFIIRRPSAALLAAVSSTVGGRHTHCPTIAVRAADGRRTMNRKT